MTRITVRRGRGRDRFSAEACDPATGRSVSISAYPRFDSVAVRSDADATWSAYDHDGDTTVIDEAETYAEVRAAAVRYLQLLRRDRSWQDAQDVDGGA